MSCQVHQEAGSGEAVCGVRHPHVAGRGATAAGRDTGGRGQRLGVTQPRLLPLSDHVHRPTHPGPQRLLEVQPPARRGGSGVS